MVDVRDLSVPGGGATDLAKRLFEREGIVVVRDLLPMPVVDAVGQFLRSSLAHLDIALQRHGISPEDGDAVARLTDLMQSSPPQLSEQDRHLFLGHFPLEVRLAEPLRAIPRFLNAHPLLFNLLGARQLFVHMPPTARYVLPHCSLARVPLHQDISYNRHMGEFCVVWAPLVPIDLACGGMAAYSRTHHASEVIVERQRAASDGWLPPIEAQLPAGAERVVLAPLDPGDIVVMGQRTLHESMPNNSDRMRLSCDFRFFGERSHSSKHYLDLATDTVFAPAAAE
jgi:hypothetical protein